LPPFKPLLLAVSLSLPAAAAAAGGDLAAGRQKAQVCAACHGPDGVSSLPATPSLGGQLDQFIQWQLVFFRSGRRPNPAMAPLVANFSDEDVRNLGAYFASLPYFGKPPVAAPNRDLAAKGKTIAARHQCANCHLDSYRGSGAAAAVADQREDYLVKALQDYRSGLRPSTGVAAMNEAAAALSDDEIMAVSHYLATLPLPQQ
jgi:cytochrome c553